MEDPEGARGETIANRDTETPVSRASEATSSGPDPTSSSCPDMDSPDPPPGGTGSLEPLLPGDIADLARDEVIEEADTLVIANPQAKEMEEISQREEKPREEKPSERAPIIEVNSVPEKERIALAEKFVATG